MCFAPSDGRWKKKTWKKCGEKKWIPSTFDMFLNINLNISNINRSAKYKERWEFPRDEIRKREKVFPELENSVLSERWSALKVSRKFSCLNTIVCDYFWLKFQLARVSCTFSFLYSLPQKSFKKAAKDVFIHPKATRLFNNSFKRRNFQLLVMV